MTFDRRGPTLAAPIVLAAVALAGPVFAQDTPRALGTLNNYSLPSSAPQAAPSPTVTPNVAPPPLAPPLSLPAIDPRPLPDTGASALATSRAARTAKHMAPAA